MGDDTLDPNNKYMYDTEMLDWLEEQNRRSLYTGQCLFRWSVTGRGWRLHETSGGPNEEPTFNTVREAIADAMRKDKQKTSTIV